MPDIPNPAATQREGEANGLLGSLARDTRGAIFLLGIGLGLVLVGAAWNVSSVGAAALWRERALDVADAAAFDAAVWHARGMNLLVMSNLLMTVFMALFTFWRMLVTVLGGLAHLCNWPVFPPCGAVQAVAGQAASVDERVAHNLRALQRSLVSTERAIASLAPVVPLVRTPATVLERYPEVLSVRSFSLALLPSGSGGGASAVSSGTNDRGSADPGAADPGVAAFDAGASDAAISRALERRLGVGVSLPVEADAFESFCSRSAEAQAWLERRSLPFDSDRLGPWWPAMTGGDPAFFCLNEVYPPELERAVQAGLAVTCAGSDESASCVQRRLARFRPAPLARGPGAISTARPWGPFTNGGVFASVFAVAELPRPLLAANDRGLMLPDALGHGSARPLSPTGHVAARAEYYFDCSGAWEDCRDDAAWRLWYRARLRPLRPDIGEAAPGLSSGWVAALEGVLLRHGGDAWRRATWETTHETSAAVQPVANR